MIRISVVIPTRNAAAFLPRALRSIAGQTGEHESETIVVDASSTDGTLEIAHAAGCRVERQETRGGIFEAIDIGNRSAAGDLIGFIGADDEYLTGAFEAVSRWYDVRQAPWSVGGLRWTDADGQALGDIGPPPAWLTPEMHAALGWNCCHHQAAFMTPDFYRDVGGFDSAFRYSGDYDFFARALRVQICDRIPQTLATFCRHGENQSMRPDPRAAAENRSVMDRYAASTGFRRTFDRALLRLALNVGNPRWALGKRVTSLRFV